MYYDPSHSRSILYDDTNSERAINHVTALLSGRFGEAVKSNFQGDNGIHAMELDFLLHFTKEIAKYSGTQFLTAVAKKQGV